MQIIIIHCKFALLELCQHVVQISALGASLLYTSNQIIYYCLFIISVAYLFEKEIVSKTMNKYCYCYWYDEKKYLNFCWVFIPITDFFFLTKGNPPENTETLNNMPRCLSLCCWNRSSIGNTELSWKKILLRYQWKSLFQNPVGIILQALKRWHLILWKRHSDQPCWETGPPSWCSYLF